MNNEVIDIIIADKAKKEVKDLVIDLVEADKAFLKFAEDVNAFSKTGLKVKTPKEFVEHTQKATKEVTYLNEANKQAKKINDDIIKTLVRKENVQTRNGKILAKLRYETQQQNKANKEEAILTSKVSTFYQKQTVILNQLTRKRKDLLLKQELGIKLDKQETAELARLTRAQSSLDNALKKTDRQVGQNFRNVGNYKSALGGLKGVVTGLVGAFGVVEGVRMAFNFTKEAIALAREAKGVEFAFKRLGDTGVDAFNRVKKSTRGLISDLDIKTALVDFDNFNISLEESDVLFEFLAVRAAQTGKSIDSLRDSLVEGLSKESKLRIDNLGISAAELNAELEKTPDFVKAVANIAKREVAEAGNILDEAANGGEKLNASFENLKLTIGQLFSGQGGGFLGVIAEELDLATQALKRFKDGFQSLIRGVSQFIKPLKEIVENIPFLNKNLDGASTRLQVFIRRVRMLLVPITALPSVLSRLGGFFKGLGASLSGVGAAFVAIRTEIKNFATSLSLLSTIEIDLLNPAKTAASAKRVLSQLKNQFVEGGSNVAEAYREAYNNALKPIVQETRETLEGAFNEDNNEAIKNQKQAIEGSIAAFQQQIAKLKEVRDTTALTNEEYEEFNKQIEALELAISKITGTYRELVEAFNQPLIDSLFQEAEDFELKFKTPDVSELEAYRDKTIKANEDIKNSIDNLKWDEALSRANEFFQEIGNLSSVFFDRRIQRYEDEINKNDLYYSNLLANEELSLKQRAALEAEQEQKRLQLEQKKREEQRKQAIAQKAFAATQVIVNTAVAISKTLAETGIFGIPLTAIVAAQGAIQLAAVLAQPIPQFKDGLFTDYEGKGKINDEKGGRYKELVVRKSGQLEMFNQRNKVIDIKKGDRVLPATMTQDILRNSAAMSMAAQQERLEQAALSQTNIVNVQIEKQIEKAMRNALSSLPPYPIPPSANSIGDRVAREVTKQLRAHNA